MRTVLMVAAMVAVGSGVSAQSPASSASRLTLSTDAGTIEIKLRPDLAPNHVRHVAKTAKAGGYDGTTFHRIIAGGIIQGGDPLTKDPKNSARYGQGGLGVLKAEFSETPFTRGVVAAARRPSSNDSGGSQFFIVLADQPGLKGQYTIFGEVTAGMEVADAIGQTPLQDGKPTIRVVIKKATAE